ncbi:hypothetical protein RHO12_10145 [Orbus sturtevantii]|uniref:hypothetical protein n=1 Tax=Orbus sturtevantii TaxID=3074109 RepID=UPI00370DB526
MNCWQKLSKRFVIKIALPHLLLSVLATAFSLSAQGGLLPANQSPQANIIAIAAVIVNLHEQQSDKQVQPVCLFKEQLQLVDVPFVPTQYNDFIPAIRLTPNNGIRAGPIFI